MDYGLKEINEMDYSLKEMNEMDHGWKKMNKMDCGLKEMNNTVTKAGVMWDWVMIKILIYNQYFLLGISGIDHLRLSALQMQ